MMRVNFSARWGCASRERDGLALNISITKYDSTLYIGMDEVLAYYACTFEDSDLHFHFQ